MLLMQPLVRHYEEGNCYLLYPVTTPLLPDVHSREYICHAYCCMWVPWLMLNQYRYVHSHCTASLVSVLQTMILISTVHLQQLSVISMLFSAEGLTWICRLPHWKKQLYDHPACSSDSTQHTLNDHDTTDCPPI